MQKVSPEMIKMDKKVAALEKQYAERDAELEKKLATKYDVTLNDHDFLHKTIDKKIEDFHLQLREDFIPVCISKKSKSISDPIAFGQNNFTIEVLQSVYIKLLASAKKHFTGRVTVVLLNQLEDKNHRFITTVSFTKKRVGSLVRLVNTTDIIHSSNPNIRYIENDDIICFKVLVEEASEAKPWLSGASNMHTNLSVLIITIAVSIMMLIR